MVDFFLIQIWGNFLNGRQQWVLNFESGTEQEEIDNIALVIYLIGEKHTV